MSYSRVRYPATGGPLFSVPFQYLDKSHVKVLVDGVEFAFEWHSQNMVSVSGIPADALEVLIRRTTPREELLVDFYDGSVFLSEDLDLQNIQLLFIAQEALDAVSESLSLGDGVVFDFQGRRGTNAADPEEEGDVVTLRYANAYLGGATAENADRAEAAADTAVQAATEAVQAASATQVIKDEFALAIANTHDAIMGLKVEGSDLILHIAEDGETLNASDYIDVVILPRGASLSVSQGNLLITV